MLENELKGYIPHQDDEIRLISIATGFGEAVESLYATALNEFRSFSKYPDKIVYPFMHSLRHYIELEAKIFAAKIDEIVKNDYPAKYNPEELRPIDHNHRIGPLLTFLKDNLLKFSNERVKGLALTVDEIIKLADLFIQHDDTDPYRYARDQEGNEFLASIREIDIEENYQKYLKIKNKFNYIDDILYLYVLNANYLVNEVDVDIKLIDEVAKELPKYAHWCEESFCGVRESIAKKHNISLTTLSKIIDVIKTDRNWSFYIGYNRPDVTPLFNSYKNIIDYAIDNNLIVLTADDLRKSEEGESLRDNLRIHQEQYRKYQEFIKTIPMEGKRLILTYREYAVSFAKPREFDDVTTSLRNSIKDDYLDQYLYGKIKGYNFLYYILTGAYYSGDKELFIMLYEYLSSLECHPGLKEMLNDDVIYGKYKEVKLYFDKE